MPPRPRPTAAGLAAALGLPVPEAAPVAPAPVPEVVPEPEPVAPAEPEPAAAPPPVVRRNRMGGVVVPAAAPAPVAEAAPVEPTEPTEPYGPRRPPPGPRPVLLRRADGSEHPVPPEWRRESGSPYEEWFLTVDEQRALVDAAPPGPTTKTTWPGCTSQLLVVDEWNGPYADWCAGSRQPRPYRL